MVLKIEKGDFMTGAIYPTVEFNPSYLRQAGAGGELEEPAKYVIEASGNYSEPFGFGQVPINVEIEVLGGMSPGDVIEAHISNDKTFAAYVSHSNGPISVSGLTAGQIAVVGLEPEAAYIRFYNNTSRNVQIKVFRIPPRR